MAKCCSFTATRDWCFRLSFSNAGLRSTTSDLGDGTVMHCWIPKSRKENKPNLLLIHGMGANAMWQWADFIRPLIARFNVYVPDLVFFGDSYTTRPERSESFQAQCVIRMMEGHGVSRMNVVGISYGGFVAYRIAEQFPAAVERLVLCCAGVCMEEKDMEAGMFQVSSVEDAASLLLPQTPEKVRELVRISFAKPIYTMPSCFLNDFIDVIGCGSWLFIVIACKTRFTLIDDLDDYIRMTHTDYPDVLWSGCIYEGCPDVYALPASFALPWIGEAETSFAFP